MTALILYGSRARGDARANSDVDILLVPPKGQIHPPRKFDGLSVHIYPAEWLQKTARAGELFACHIAYEGVSIYAAEDLIEALRRDFVWKDSYERDRKVALAVLELLSRTRWGWTDEIRRRFFWSVRTLALTVLAERRIPDFSLSNIDETLRSSGVLKAFEERESISFLECIDIGRDLTSKFDDLKALSSDEISRMLVASGGIGLNTVEILETEQAIDVGNLAIYI